MKLTWPMALRLPKPPAQPGGNCGTVSRRVALLGAGPDDPKTLLQFLFDTEIGGVPPLQPEPETDGLLRQMATAGSGTAVVLPSRMIGLRLPSSRRLGRTQAWEIMPAGAGSAEAGVEGWQHLADVALVGWPWRLVGGETRDAKVRLGGSVGIAQRAGRLVRAAVVITGLPMERVPRHASQAVLLFPMAEPVASHLERRMREAERRAGDPLADPGWRETIRTLQRDTELMALLEAVRRALGKDVLVFFAGGPGRSRLGFESFLDWIQAGTKQRRDRRDRAARALCAGAAALWLLSMTVLALSPFGCATQQRTATAHAAVQQVWLGQALARYDAWFQAPAHLPPAQSARDEVARALVLARDRAWCEARIADLEIAMRAAVVGVDSLGPEARQHRARALQATLDEQLAKRAARHARALHGTPTSNGSIPWDAALFRTGLTVALLSALPSNAGFHGWTLPDSLRIRLFTRLEHVSGPGALGAVERLFRARSAEDFYGQVLACSSSVHPSVREAFAIAVAAAPRVDRSDVREDPNMRAAAYYERRIQAQRMESSTTLFRFLRNAKSGPRDDANRASSAGGPLLIKFSVPGETRWHLDIRVPGVGVQLVSVPEGGAGAEAALIIPRGHLGMALRIRINRYVPFHVAATTYGPCESSVVRVIEVEKSGTILAYDGSFVIVYSAQALETDPAVAGRETP